MAVVTSKFKNCRGGFAADVTPPVGAVVKATTATGDRRRLVLWPAAVAAVVLLLVMLADDAVAAQRKLGTEPKQAEGMQVAQRPAQAEARREGGEEGYAKKRLADLLARLGLEDGATPADVAGAKGPPDAAACAVLAEALDSFRSRCGKTRVAKNATPLLAAIEMLLAGPCPAGVAADGLVAHWPCDENSGTTVRDASGNGLNGTSTAAWGPGKIGGALLLSGKNTNYVTLALPVDRQPGTSSFSVAMWVNPSTFDIESANKNRMAFAISNSPDWQVPLLVTSAGSITFGAYYQVVPGAAETKSERVGSGAALDIGEWTHVCGVFDREKCQVTLFINGGLDAETAVDAGFAPRLLGDKAGVSIGSSWQSFAGSVDDVWYFKRALSADEVRALMKGTSAPAAATGTDPAAAKADADGERAPRKKHAAAAGEGAGAAPAPAVAALPRPAPEPAVPFTLDELNAAIKAKNPNYDMSGGLLRDDQGVVAGLYLLGKRVKDVSGLSGKKLRHLHLAQNPISDISALKGMPLEYLNLAQTQVDDDDMAVLEGMPLTWLCLSDTKITKFRFLARLTKLESLSIYSLPVTNNDLAHLKRLPLTWLDISFDKQITELSALEGMGLTRLGMHDTQVDDLKPLVDLPLKELEIWNCPNIKTLSRLRQCSYLERLVLPSQFTDARELKYLRDLAKLRYLDYKNKDMRTAEQFWKDLDAGKSGK